MSYKARVQYLLTDTASLPCTTQADATQDSQTDKYITLIEPSLQKIPGHTYRLVRKEWVQVPLHKVVNSHSHIRRDEIINNNQCKSVYNNQCKSVCKKCKSVTIARLNMFMINGSITKLDKLLFFHKYTYIYTHIYIYTHTHIYI